MLLSHAASKGTAETRPLSVSEAMQNAKLMLESITVKLVGEVSEVSAKAGYKAVYFTVKDAGASLPCMMWVNRYRDAGIQLVIGQKVELTGRFTLYAPKGRMNFEVFAISMAGEGELRRRVSDLAQKLEREGLMEPGRKRPIPRINEHIGLVTSPRGKAVHDVLRTMRLRFPLARISLAGVTVEGPGAASEIINGMVACVDAGCEVVLVVRGGGTFEDLMPFNDERLARTIAACPVPVVTGIGHEPDTTIADMVADMRASTPTAAAASVCPETSAVARELSSRAPGMKSALMRSIETRRTAIERVETRPVFKDPHALFSTDMLTLDMMQDRLSRAIPNCLAKDRGRLEEFERRLKQRAETATAPFEHGLALRAGRLHDLSPLAVLARGYAMAHDEEGGIVSSTSSVREGSRIHVSISDGTLACTVDEITPATNAHE